MPSYANAEASAQWSALLREAPEYSQARTNLAILQGKAVEGHAEAFAHAAATPSLSQAHESAPIIVEDVLGKP